MIRNSASSLAHLKNRVDDENEGGTESSEEGLNSSSFVKLLDRLRDRRRGNVRAELCCRALVRLENPDRVRAYSCKGAYSSAKSIRYNQDLFSPFFYYDSPAIMPAIIDPARVSCPCASRALSETSV